MTLSVGQKNAAAVEAGCATRFFFAGELAHTEKIGAEQKVIRQRENGRRATACGLAIHDSAWERRQGGAHLAPPLASAPTHSGRQRAERDAMGTGGKRRERFRKFFAAERREASVSRGLGHTQVGILLALRDTEGYRQEQDVLAPFLADCCDFGPRYTVPVGALYDAYAEWCQQNGEEALRKATFCKALAERGLRKTREGHANTWTWHGARLRLAATRCSGSPQEK